VASGIKVHCAYGFHSECKPREWRAGDPWWVGPCSCRCHARTPGRGRLARLGVILAEATFCGLVGLIDQVRGRWRTEELVRIARSRVVVERDDGPTSPERAAH